MRGGSFSSVGARGARSPRAPFWGLLAALGAGLWMSSPAGAECPPGVRLSGDPAVAEVLLLPLRERGVEVPAAGPCAYVEVSVTREGEALRLQLLPPTEGSARVVLSTATAVALIEAWSRLGQDDPLAVGELPFPRPREPPSITWTLPIVETPSERRTQGMLSIGVGVVSPSPEAQGWAVRGAACLVRGSWCLGGAVVLQQTTDGSCGDDCVTDAALSPPINPLAVKTQHRNAWVQAEAERAFSIRGATARLGVGAGSGVHRPRSETTVFGVERGELLFVFLGSASASLETKLTARTALELRLLGVLDPLNLAVHGTRYQDELASRASFFEDGSLLFANGPTLSAQFLVGLRYGAP